MAVNPDDRKVTRPANPLTDAEFASLVKLIEVISQAQTRRNFIANPEAALGAEYADLPAEVGEALKDLTDLELRAVARLGQTLTAAGFVVETPNPKQVWYL